MSDTERRTSSKLLVHNCNHADIYFTIRPKDNTSDLIARPRFDSFKQVCETLKEGLSDTENIVPIKIPARSTDLFPVGFRFEKPIYGSLDNMRVRDLENSESAERECEITCVYFPLAAVIIPYFLGLYEELHTLDLHECDLGHRVIFLTGCGEPRNPHFGPEDNSTRIVADLLTCFIREFYPNIQVDHFDSGPGIFHYTENARFIQETVRPDIETRRQMCAQKYGADWDRHFHVTLSMTDGTPARVSAITEGLRLFKPDLLHVWSLKTLWNEYPKVEALWEDDIEFHRFSSLEVQPPREVSSLDQNVRSVVEEVKTWKKLFLRTRKNGNEEIESFWLRKTKQPILSVLMIQKPNESPRFIRAMNMEVSMPTGSLCAERNAIGTALSRDPSIKREHFKMVAVLSLNLNKSGSTASSPPPAKKRRLNHGNSQKVVSPTLGPAPTLSPVSSIESPDGKFFLDRNALKRKMTRQPSIPRKRFDLNPRGPCGACTEWLKKIAEINPNFKIVTFSDEECSKVFVRNLI